MSKEIDKIKRSVDDYNEWNKTVCVNLAIITAVSIILTISYYIIEYDTMFPK